MLRCYFVIRGHMRDSEPLDGLSDQEAIEKARELLATRGDNFDAFEVWEGLRLVLREPRANGSSTSSTNSA
jgi:hypothetical protein